MSVVLKEREFLITGSEFLLVSQADLARVVDLGPDVGVLVQGVLAADGEGGAAAHGAGPGDAGLQGGAVLQVNTTSVNLKMALLNQLLYI